MRKLLLLIILPLCLFTLNACDDGGGGGGGGGDGTSYSATITNLGTDAYGKGYVLTFYAGTSCPTDSSFYDISKVTQGNLGASDTEFTVSKVLSAGDYVICGQVDVNGDGVEFEPTYTAVTGSVVVEGVEHNYTSTGGDYGIGSRIYTVPDDFPVTLTFTGKTVGIADDDTNGGEVYQIPAP